MTGPLCGAPHHRHPETLCTEPAGHYQPDRDPHAGPLVLDGQVRGGAAWDEPGAVHMIQPGQTYRSCKPSASEPEPRHTRIRVAIVPAFHADNFNHGKVIIETLTEDGRAIRRRAINSGQLHGSATTRDGQPRRTGYALEQP